uniref:Uncharacterized protein n=1 Tax=Elaeophora elaphi TaxID=1147741 RepID=A0A0R3RJY3_9BILA
MTSADNDIRPWACTLRDSREERGVVAARCGAFYFLQMKSLSVIMQAAMSGMGSLAGYSFTQLTPTQLTPYTVATSSAVTTTASVLQHQPVGSSSTTTAMIHSDDITMKNELP